MTTPLRRQIDEAVARAWEQYPDADDIRPLMIGLGEVCIHVWKDSAARLRCSDEAGEPGDGIPELPVARRRRGLGRVRPKLRTALANLRHAHFAKASLSTIRR